MQLYILINNSGDGSYSNRFILDPAVLQACQDNFECSESHPGVDGDGFHYTTINVPDGSTAESLGLSEHQLITAQSLAEGFNIHI